MILVEGFLMPSIEFIWSLLGSNQFGNFILIILTAKIMDYDHNIANIIEALSDIADEDDPDIYYETIFPFKIPRFHTKKVKNV